MELFTFLEIEIWGSRMLHLVGNTLYDYTLAFLSRPRSDRAPHQPSEREMQKREHQIGAMDPPGPDPAVCIITGEFCWTVLSYTTEA